MGWGLGLTRPPAADTPESPWSWMDCVGIGTTNGVRSGFGMALNGRYARVPLVLEGPCGDRGHPMGVRFGFDTAPSSGYTQVPSVLDGPCGDRDTQPGLKSGFDTAPMADTPESLESWTGRCGDRGAPRGFDCGWYTTPPPPQQRIHPNPSKWGIGTACNRTSFRCLALDAPKSLRVGDRDGLRQNSSHAQR